jgi:GntR family transcriptional repressor for pyruvate dehydrogenase complex
MDDESSVSAVASRLLDLVADGKLPLGSRLPPERLLAASLGVGRSAVREALAALEILGLIDVRPGSGTYVRGDTSELLPQALRWGLALQRERTRDLIEVRGALEVYAARLAATRMPPPAIERMAADVQAMDDAAESDLAGFVEADLRFHLDLATSTGNTVLLDLLQTLRSLLRVWSDRAVHDPQDAALAARQHRAVLDAIRAGDADGAASAMAEHMHTAAERLSAALDTPQEEP